MLKEKSTMASPKLSTLLASGVPIVLDGALATYLETLGADISTPLWSAHLLTASPSLIKRAHYDYFTAGASIAITSSYQASVPGLVKNLSISEAEAKGLIEKSVELAREARDEYLANGEAMRRAAGALLVAGSVGPYATYLADGSEYRGDYSIPHDAMMDFHRGRIAALIDAGVHLLAVETQPSYAEIQALAQLLHQEYPSVEAYFSFTLKDAQHISDDTPLSTVLTHLNSYPNIVAVGVNCVSQDTALAALTEMKKSTDKTLLVYPNSGEVWNAETRGWEGERTGGVGWAERTRQYWEAGARGIGGCCRTTPGDVEVVSATL
ncbi:homocysteine S-methyltransferase, partial [Lentithecium fluviatile CBS 122367]